MKKVDWQKACFVTTAVDMKGFLKTHFPEIAVAGRSNVGKSSLLNHLFQQKKLVKTSSTPGKTQAVNFFLVDEKVVFVDLPGYGFAKVPKEMRKEWGPLIEGYLKRESLRAVLFLFDIRRDPSEEDLQFLSWLRFHNRPVIVVLTKADKLTHSQQKPRVKAILEGLDMQDNPYICYSTLKNQGRHELCLSLENLL